MANEKFGLAVDIGTTTLAAAFVAEDGRIVGETARANSQAALGADVMNRIRAAAEDGRGRELQALLRADLTAMLEALWNGRAERGAAQGTPAVGARPEAIVLAGNTTMLHLLRGYDCAGLGRYPYTPVSLAREEHRAEALLPGLSGALRDARTILLPGISAFVGADIVAGLYAAEALRMVDGEAAKKVLFLDLGTNGEMALVRRTKTRGAGVDGPADTADEESAEIAVCSTAAGPVFEGAGIRHGMRGEPGAIADVVLTPGAAAGSRPAKMPAVHIRTIGGVPPVGICGSGVLEAVSELARLHLIDAAGTLAEPWFHEGFPLAVRADGTALRLYQEDIRAVQLAKAAIRAGAETLPLSCGSAAKQIDEVLVAGAFGRALNFSRLAPLGLIPPALLSRCRAVGNTSLAGAARAAGALLRGEEESVFAETARIVRCAREVPLAGRQDFEVCYLAMMEFGR